MTPTPDQPPPTSPTPSLWYGAFRVFDLSLSDMLWSKRTIFMALVVGAPVLMAVVIRLLTELGAPTMRVDGSAVTGPVVFGLMMWVFFVRFSVPVLAVFYGTSLIADEVEDKTITYLFSRPIPRGSVLLGKYLAYLVCTIFVVLPAVIVIWLLIVPLDGSLGAGFPDLVKDLGVLAVGLAVYGALFALLGATLKRPLLVGLIYIFVWESFVLAVPGNLKRLSVGHYLQGLVPHTMPSDSPVGLLQAIFREVPSLPESGFWLAAILVVCLWVAARAVTRREYVLEQ